MCPEAIRYRDRRDSARSPGCRAGVRGTTFGAFLNSSLMSLKALLTRAALVAAVPTAACQQTPSADPRMVSEWMHTMYGAIRVERLSPPVASRLMAYASTALYSGLAAV